jgi:hypothetical protein
MKAHLLNSVLSLFFFTIITQLWAQEKETFRPGKYKNLVELDMSGIVRGNIGTNLIYRRKYENKNSQLVFADRIPFWRFGLYLNGYAQNTTLDSSSSLNQSRINTSNGANIYIAPYVGRETMFHWGKFNIFYAIDMGVSYNYIDTDNVSKNPCIANAFGLNLSFSGGLRYYFNDRFSLGVQSTPLSVGGIYKFGQFYPRLGESWNVPNIKFKTFNFSMAQNWLSMLGFAYHF